MDKFEKLTKYKQLLDQGIITQDEFDDAKSDLLKRNAIHEHLSTGARVASNSFGSLKKKTEGAYGRLKEKGNQWIEKELEKEQQKENEKKEKKENQQEVIEKKHQKAETGEQIQEAVHYQRDRKTDTEQRVNRIKTYIKKAFTFLLIILLLLVIALSAIFFNREKTSFTADKTDAVHYLEYSISDNYKKKKTLSNKNDNNEIVAEKDTYEIYSKSNNLIATYSIEYLGEDIDIDKYKAKASRSLIRKEIKQSNDSTTIDGYYKSNKLSIHNITGNGLIKQRVLLFTKDYSSFMIVFKCNAWNYDAEVCDRLFDSVKTGQYSNPNIATALNITYKGSEKSGYKPVPEDFKVEVKYKNGKKSIAEMYQLHAPKRMTEKDDEVMIECHGIKKTIHLRLSDEEEKKTDKEPKSDNLIKDDEMPYGDGGQQA